MTLCPNPHLYWLCWHLVKAVLLSWPQELPTSKAMFSECSSDLQIRGHSRSVNRGSGSQACTISTGLSIFASHRHYLQSLQWLKPRTLSRVPAFQPPRTQCPSCGKYSQAGRVSGQCHPGKDGAYVGTWFCRIPSWACPEQLETVKRCQTVYLCGWHLPILPMGLGPSNFQGHDAHCWCCWSAE